MNKNTRQSLRKNAHHNNKHNNEAHKHQSIGSVGFLHAALFALGLAIITLSYLQLPKFLPEFPPTAAAAIAITALLGISLMFSHLRLSVRINTLEKQNKIQSALIKLQHGEEPPNPDAEFFGETSSPQDVPQEPQDPQALDLTESPAAAPPAPPAQETQAAQPAQSAPPAQETQPAQPAPAAKQEQPAQQEPPAGDPSKSAFWKRSRKTPADEALELKQESAQQASREAGSPPQAQPQAEQARAPQLAAAQALGESSSDVPLEALNSASAQLVIEPVIAIWKRETHYHHLLPLLTSGDASYLLDPDSKQQNPEYLRLVQKMFFNLLRTINQSPMFAQRMCLLDIPAPLARNGAFIAATSQILQQMPGVARRLIISAPIDIIAAAPSASSATLLKLSEIHFRFAARASFPVHANYSAMLENRSNLIIFDLKNKAFDVSTPTGQNNFARIAKEANDHGIEMMVRGVSGNDQLLSYSENKVRYASGSLFGPSEQLPLK